jgi:hypothetical protein
MISDLKLFIKKYWLLLILFMGYVTITYLLKIPNCLIKLFIGFPCPSCGMTRAGFAILRFDFEAAFYYNPLIYLLPLIALVCVFPNTSIFKKLYHSKIFWSLIITIVVINYIIRLIYIYPNPPMDYDSNNIISNTINFIINLFKPNR